MTVREQKRRINDRLYLARIRRRRRRELALLHDRARWPLTFPGTANGPRGCAC